MCGIVGAIAKRNVTSILLDGLKRLEYRGYDSAGLVVLEHDKKLKRKRTVGKVKELIQAFDAEPFVGNLGIAHTRWATHGKPCETNAHPHFSNNTVAIVHNGIIENYQNIQQRLLSLGYSFETETDTEVAAHLIHYHLLQRKNLIAAVQAAVDELEGAFALGIICAQEPHHLIAVRKGAPVVIGLNQDGNYIASDPLALLPITQSFIYLEDGDIADLEENLIRIYAANGQIVEREIHTLNIKQDASDKGHYRHYMLKEIFEQPEVIENTLSGCLGKQQILEEAFGPKARALFDQVEQVRIVACGTSYHAGMIAAYWMEELAGIPCRVEIASEIRYRHHVISPNTLFVAISQSGETADTLAALRLAKTQGYVGTLAICNVPESSLMRESDVAFMTRAGTEIGVASTKAFTTQLTALLLLTIALGRRHQLKQGEENLLVEQLRHLSEQVQAALNLDGKIKSWAKLFADKEHALFLGRGLQYPIALEGALKLKEISYIHAEAYPAGELKHGPLALVDKNMPVIAVAPNDALLEKLKSNLNEVRARGGELFVFADEAASLKEESGIHVLTMPATAKFTAPIIYTIPLQLLAYHVAILKGTDVDQPRNLAKSVTVE